MSQIGTGTARSLPISVVQPAARIEDLVASPFPEDAVAAAGHKSLTENLELALLQRRDLPPAALEAMSRNHSALNHRKTLLGIAQHARTPRHVSLPLLRKLFTFELMELVLAPAAAADLKLVAEELLINKLGTLSLGERIPLARRGSAGVAGALFQDSEQAVIEAALQNPRTSEASIIKALARSEVSALLLAMLSGHTKWSLRREIQLAILRRGEASQEVVQRVAARLPKFAIYELMQQVRLPQRREELLREALKKKS